MEATLEKVRFPDLLFEGVSGLIEVREINNDGHVKLRFFKSLQDFKGYTPDPNRNVYFGVYTRSKAKGTKENCLYTSALWADFDHMTVDEVQEKIFISGLPKPSILVNSGHGVHSYWLLDKKAGNGTESILKAIAEKTGADTKATDISRIMRLPGTWNVKRDPVRCEVIEHHERRYSLDTFKQLLGVGMDKQGKEIIEELESSKMACIRLIAKGVGKGQRNFGLGKITAYLKQQGSSRKKAFDIVKRWNRNNTPHKPEKELTDEFNRFWDSDYKYLGCKFTNPDLERVNRQLCPMGECQFHSMQSAQIINDESTVSLDNEIFKSTVYPKVKALEIACFSWIVKEKEVTRERLSHLVNRHAENKNFKQAVKGLKEKGMIEIKKAIKKQGIPERIILKQKSNYGRGYTPVPNLLTKLYTKKGISDNAYKLMVLLKSYSYGKSEVYPTIETMAMKLGVSEKWVSELLKWLDEYEGLIKREYKQLDNGKTKLFIKLFY